MDKATVERLRRLLVDSSCTSIENLGNYLQIIFAERRLTVEAAWRLIQKQEIVVGSDSEELTLQRLPHLLTGLTVNSLEVFGDFNDLRLRFDDDVVLEVFADSEKYEHWKLVGGPEEMVIAGPGALWSEF